MFDTQYRFHQLLPTPLSDVDLAAAYAYPEPLSQPWVRANMVTSADGAAWGASGRTKDLSTPADRAVMAMLRALCDVVLAGAGTAREENYRPVRPREVHRDLRAGRPATPRLAIVTRSLDLHPDLLATAPPEAPTLIVTTESAPAGRRREAARHAEVVVAGASTVDPRALVDAFAERGLHRVLCEGGPHLLAELVAADLLDELCLTVSPALMGPAAARIVAGELPATPRALSLESLLESDGSLFLRYGRG